MMREGVLGGLAPNAALPSAASVKLAGGVIDGGALGELEMSSQGRSLLTWLYPDAEAEA